MRKQKFEFRVFPANEYGEMSTKNEFVLEEEWQDVTSARGRAGRLAKNNNGPVDLAYAYEPGGVGQDWNDRYISTARPSEFAKSGYEFEVLS